MGKTASPIMPESHQEQGWRAVRSPDRRWKCSHPAGEKQQSQVPRAGGETFLSWFSAKLSLKCHQERISLTVLLRASHQQIFFPQETFSWKMHPRSRPQLVARCNSDQWLHYVDLLLAPFRPPDSPATCLVHTRTRGLLSKIMAASLGEVPTKP